MYGVKKMHRCQKGFQLNLFSFPECYDAEDCGELMIFSEYIKPFAKFVGK